MVCPLCGDKRARRGCPALGRQICAVCCGTKRIVEIHCPPDCPYLATARQHPPAAAVRQDQHDLTLMLQFMRDLNERQLQLFWVITTFLARYEAPELNPIIDDDIAEAVSAMASTFETSVRGVIYEHRPASRPAQRLAAALKPLVLEAGHGGGTGFERDAAVVLRRIGEAINQRSGPRPTGSRAFADLVARVITKAETKRPVDEAPRLIVP